MILVIGTLRPRCHKRSPGELDRDAAVETVLSRLAARRSGWNAADIRGEAERLIARSEVVAEAAARLELAEDLTARTIAASVPLVEQAGMPEHIRTLTSRPAVGRGGVLDLAARWANHDAVLSLDTVRRFADPGYADLSLAMRTAAKPDKVFDRLAERGHVVVRATEQERTAALATEAAETGAMIVADTREQVADLNAAI